MKTTCTIASLVACLTVALAAHPPCRSGYRWGPNGHRIVAQIGQNHLDAAADRQVKAIRGPHELAALATWPDEIRSDENWDFAKPWHFISVDDDKSLAEVLAESSNNKTVDNLVEAIHFFSAILQGDVAKRQQFEELLKKNRVQPRDGSIDLTALSFLVHFIGDVHQPLHVGRKDDRGGNTEKVNWFGEVSNLHKVWDEGLIESEGLSFSELVRFIDHPTETQCKEWHRGTVESWAQESIELRPGVYAIRDKINPENDLPDLGYEYAYRHVKTVKLRLLQGGVRLASVLNRLFR